MADDKPSPDRVDELIERVRYLEYLVREQIGRIYAIEQRLGIAPHPGDLPPHRSGQGQAGEAGVPPGSQAAQPGVDVAPGVGERPPQTRPPGALPRTPPRSAADFSRIAPGQPQATGAPAGLPRESGAPAKSRANLEDRIGGNWFNWIGIIAICFGVAFFLKYAFENQWINPTGRVIIGVAVGIGFLIGAERLRSRGYKSYAYGLSGGGILILYLSVYAASVYYELLSRPPAFLCMVAVTAAAALLAARYNALAIAILGLIGGFLTPLLLSTHTNNEAGLFGYLLFLDIGVLTLAYSKHWRSLNYLAFAGTALLFGAWQATYYTPDALWVTEAFLTAFFAIFALLAVLYNVVNRQPTHWLDLILVFANAVLYFGTSYAILDPHYHSALGLFAILMAAFYLTLGGLAYRRDREDRLLILTFVGLAILFCVLAVPIQLNQQWITMGWALEGAIMTWVGLRSGDKTSRYAALLVFVIAGLHWLLADAADFAYRMNGGFTPLLNQRGASCAVLIASMGAAAWLHQRYGAAEERSIFIGLLAAGANGLAVVLLSLDANDYFEQSKAALTTTGRPPTDAPGYPYADVIANNQQFTLSAIWITYGAATLIVGIRQHLRWLRIGALVLLAIAALKALALDLRYYDAPWHTPIVNQTLLTFALLIGALACGVWFYARSDIDRRESAAVVPALVVIANILAVVGLSAEATGYFDAQRTQFGGDVQDAGLHLARQLSLSVTWIVYGGVLLALGIARRRRLLRMMALLLLCISILKVFFIDLSELNSGYRIVSFIVLGAILLIVSFLYQRFRRQLTGLIESDSANAD